MSQTESPRLVTFEIDESEELILLAGHGEYDRRPIFQGRVEGRYAIVPVDEIVQEASQRDVDDDLALEDMTLVGQTVVVPEDGHSTVSLRQATEQIQRMDRRGAYGLLWVPFEE